MPLKNWSTTSGNNNAAPPNGAPEGWAPSDVNNWGRQVMADVRSWYEDAAWTDLGFALTYIDGDTFRISGNVTAFFTVNRRIRVTGTGFGTLYGRISASVFASGNTTVDLVFDTGAMDNTLSAVSVSIAPTVGKPITSAAIDFLANSVPSAALPASLITDIAAIKSQSVAGIKRTVLTAASGTFTSDTKAIFQRIYMVGGGGGGSAQNTNNGAPGGNTSFNGVVANGGQGGATGGQGGAGGTGGTGTAEQRIPGNAGLTSPGWGGTGGNSVYGGSPQSAASSSGAGVNAQPNSGAGGSSAGTGSSSASAVNGGGGAGEYVEFSINSPAASYSYTIGPGGVGGAAGVAAGGNGGSGRIIVEEFLRV